MIYFSDSSGEEELQQSQNSTRNSNRSPQRRSERTASVSRPQQKQTTTSRQHQPATSKNQAGPSRTQGNNNNATATSNQPKPTGAAKRKTTKKTVKSAASTFRNPLDHIRFLQTHVENLIPKSPLCRLIREVLQSHGDYRLTKVALDALQEAAETYLVGLFDDSFRLTLHRNRVTIQPMDLQLCLYLRGVADPGIAK
jgi:histone H3